MKFRTLLSAFLLFPFAPGGLAEDGKESFDPAKANAPKLTDAPLSVIDKLIAVEQDLGRKGQVIDWNAQYGKVANEFAVSGDIEDARACVLIGFKLADATLALKAQNAEEFKKCVELVEQLSVNLDVPKEALDRSFQVKSAVERNDWMDAFLQLSMMRQDVMRQLESIHKGDRSRGVLIVCGAWMQASRVAYLLVTDDRLDASATNYLRAPLFVDLMRTELEAIEDPALKSSPQVTDLLADLPEIKQIVTIDKNPDIVAGQISRERLERLDDIASAFFVKQLR